MKTLTFQNPVSLSSNGFAYETRRYQFPFTVVNTELIGSPEEKSATHSGSLTVGISMELQVNWRLTKATDDELAKVLFEFGRRDLIEKIKVGDLPEKQELTLTTKNAPDECPFEISRIREPEGASYEVEANLIMNSLSMTPHNSLALRKSRSHQALSQIYDEVQGSRTQPFGFQEMAHSQDWSHQETEEVIVFLLNEGWIKHFSVGGIFCLMHDGIVAAERQVESAIVKKRRTNRALILDKVYQVTRQNGPTQIDLEPLAVAEGIKGIELSNLYLFLTGAEYMRPRGAGYYIIMLPEDQLRAEQVLSSSQAVEVFFCYSHEDEKLRDGLAKHLRLMEREGVISAWHDRKITAGQEWEEQINVNLDRARVILLLVSADFIDSDYCWDIEMKRALAKHEAGTARVVPIILRPCEWHGSPFGKLQGLPTDGRPILDPFWHSPDEAFVDIAKGLRKLIGELEN